MYKIILRDMHEFSFVLNSLIYHYPHIEYDEFELSISFDDEMIFEEVHYILLEYHQK